MLIRDIERCLVNINLSYNVFFGLHLPIECRSDNPDTLAINKLFNPYVPLYEIMCKKFTGFDGMINKFLEEGFNVKSDELFPMHLMTGSISNRRFMRQRITEHFVTFVEQYEEEIMLLQTQVCLAVVGDPDMQELLRDMKDAYLSIPTIDNIKPNKLGLSQTKIDMTAIEPHLITNSDDLITINHTELTERLLRFVRKSLTHQMDVLYHPNRYRKMEKLRREMEEKYDMIDEFIEFRTNDKGVTSYEILSKDVLKFTMPTKKEKIKNTQKNVNKLDEEQGVDLKKPKETVDEYEEYHEKVMAYKYCITKLISGLNGSNSDKYASDTKVFGIEVKKIKINDKFKALSKWFDDNAYDVSDIRFKARYITYIGTWVVNNLEEIADKAYNLNGDGKYIKYDAKLAYIETASCALFDLIHKMLEGKPFGDELMYFNNVQVFLKSKKRKLKQTAKKLHNMTEQTVILSDRCRKFSKAEHDITMDTLLKLTYLASTNSTNCKNTVKFNSGFKFRNRGECENMISELGKSVIKECKKNGTSPMFSFFLKCNPNIYSRHDTSVSTINVGLAALHYYAFISNDTNIKRIVEKIS